MAKQTKQRTVKYPPKQGNLSRREVKRAVKEVVDAGRTPTKPKHSTTSTPQAPSKPRPSSKPKNT